jgi:hypothetical protein
MKSGLKDQYFSFLQPGSDLLTSDFYYYYLQEFTRFCSLFMRFTLAFCNAAASVQWANSAAGSSEGPELIQAREGSNEL